MKRSPVLLIVLALLAAGITVVLAETFATTQVAATGNACQTGTIYSLGSAGNIYQLDTTSGARTHMATLPSNPSYNGLGISTDGSRYFAVASIDGTTSQLFEFDTASSQSIAGPTIAGYSFVMGALDPATGIFYAGAYSGSDVLLYAFDTSTSPPTALPGPIAEISGFGGGSGGDMVFDSTGHLYLVSGGSVNQLMRVSQPIPTTGTDAALTATQLASISVSSPNGITFDGDGYLYVSSSTTLTKVDPGTGATVSSVAIGSGVGGNDTVDLAGCEYNGQLQLQADVAGRYDPSDQFSLSITGGGVSGGNTATTSGPATGLQSDSASTAGPIAALAGTTYEIHEAAAGGAVLSDYTLSAACVDTGNGSAAVALTPVTAGSSTDWSLTFPDASSRSAVVACTFTDTPAVHPTISLAKTLLAPRVAAGDQFSVAIRTGSPSGPIVSSTANATTSGTGATVDAGTGTTGTFAGDAGTVYYLTESGVGGTDLGDYLATISCTDAANRQTGLPVGAAFSGSFAITPVNGAQIACVLSNGVQSYTVAETADQATAAAGGVVTYAVTVVNTGSYSYPASTAGFAIDLAGQLDDGAVVAGSVTASSGSASVAGSTLAWSGALPSSGPGSSVTVTYQVQVAASDSGDHLLQNSLTATDPGGHCAAGGTCTLSTPVQSYAASLVADAATVGAGGTVDYTLTVVNTGRIAYTGLSATADLDLTGVSDDATYVRGSASASAGAMQLASGFIAWSGALPVAPAAGSTVTIHFSVQVPAGGSRGDGRLTSALTAQAIGGSCRAGCDESIPVQQFAVSVAADANTVLPGQVVTYTITAANTGQVAYASAGFSDDLAGLLGDATLVPDSVTASAGSAAVSAGTLAWSGPLPVGGSAVVTFSIKLDDPTAGTPTLHNDITLTGAGAITPKDPDAGTPAGIKSFSVTPQIVATGVTRGSVVAFSAMVTNTGTAAYTTAAPASFRAALSGAFTGAKIDADGTAGATTGPDSLGWSGALGVGASVPVDFTVILGAGDGDPQLLAAIVTPAGSGGGCNGAGSGAVCAAPTAMVSGAVAAQMIAAATGELAFTGSDVQAFADAGALALLAGLAIELLALVLRPRRGHHRRGRPPVRAG